jgi:RNA 2',3'-cyclic 3'-phosphodiesterase
VSARGGSSDRAGARELVRRVFFALWPDDSLRSAFAEATHEIARSVGGRLVSGRNLHVTLLFLGSVAEDRLTELEALAAEVAGTNVASTSELLFNRIEHWKRPRVLVATASPSAGVAVAGALAAKLLEVSLGAGFTPDLKTLGLTGDSLPAPFRPHVTLARKVPHPIPAVDIDPLRWGFTGFALVRSHRGPEGSDYSVMATFPLQPQRDCHGTPNTGCSVPSGRKFE